MKTADAEHRWLSVGQCELYGRVPPLHRSGCDGSCASDSGWYKRPPTASKLSVAKSRRAGRGRETRAAEMMRRSGSEGRSAVETWGVAAGWEMRPGGLLVQQRAPVPGKPPPPQVRVRISHGAARYVVSVSSIATFGELKKLLTADSGLQPAEQRLLYKGKQRGDSEYLDACGVKNRSKIVLVEDSTSLERRYTEIRKNARMQSAHRAVSTISLEVDKLADQVQQPHPLEFCVMY
ncbi:hypothetical protein BHM03_00038488 [Ensete ventricosum]|nr:hypothetical protein BHM03_00038488 [Ensete ventricosum]